jgi:hypothetical protein
MTLVAVVKRDCPTCQLVAPALMEIAGAHELVVYTQDDPAFPDGLDDVRHDDTLERSYRYGIETVPTLLELTDGAEAARAVGWDRDQWRQLTGLSSHGADLPDRQPGCGARNVEPGMPERLALRFGDVAIASRSIEVSDLDDPIEVAYDRGWSDGLPVTPPTDVRVARMLAGTSRRGDEVIGLIPPDLNECTVEKAAINAVMAGCRPEYFPVVLATIETALVPEFAMHGLLCTTWFSGPVVIVNGPIARRIGMNSGVNATWMRRIQNSLPVTYTSRPTIARYARAALEPSDRDSAGAGETSSAGEPGATRRQHPSDHGDDHELGDRDRRQPQGAGHGPRRDRRQCRGEQRQQDAGLDVLPHIRSAPQAPLHLPGDDTGAETGGERAEDRAAHADGGGDQGEQPRDRLQALLGRRQHDAGDEGRAQAERQRRAAVADAARLLRPVRADLGDRQADHPAE